MQKEIENRHMVQFYLDFGSTEYGPWARIGFSNTEYLVGFYASEKVGQHRPSQEAAAGAATVTNLHPVTA